MNTKQKSGGALKWVLIAISAIFLCVMLILPLIYILITAFQKGIGTYLAAITDEYALKAVKLTLQVTLWAVCINTIFGLCAAW